MPSNKMFDLRIVVERDSHGHYTAKTILGNNGIMFCNTSVTNKADEALIDLIEEMEVSSGISMLLATPGLSQQFIDDGHSGNKSTSAPAAAVPTNKPATRNFKKYTGPLQRAVDIPLEVPKGDCEERCSSYDMFGAAKCGNFCPTRK